MSATFGDLRSMIAARDWSRWHEIDLANLGVPLEVAQAYVRDYVDEALWGIPIQDRTGWIDLRSSGAVYVCVAYAPTASHESYLPDEGAQVMRKLLPDYEGTYYTAHHRSAVRSGEKAQYAGVLIRAAALLMRSWPLSAKQIRSHFEKCPRKGPARDAYDARWGPPLEVLRMLEDALARRDAQANEATP